MADAMDDPGYAAFIVTFGIKVPRFTRDLTADDVDIAESLESGMNALIRREPVRGLNDNPGEILDAISNGPTVQQKSTAVLSGVALLVQCQHDPLRAALEKHIAGIVIGATAVDVGETLARVQAEAARAEGLLYALAPPGPDLDGPMIHLPVIANLGAVLQHLRVMGLY